VLVVHDLVVDVDLLAGKEIQELVHDVDGHMDTGTEAAGVGEKDSHAWVVAGRGGGVGDPLLLLGSIEARGTCLFMTATLDRPTEPMTHLREFGPDAPARDRPVSLDEARRYVQTLTTGHYENFSVLSRLVPDRLRDDFAAVYAYCRWCDDLGDETGKDEAARARSLALLGWWRTQLRGCFANVAAESDAPELTHPVFVALVPTIQKHALTMEPFEHLIQAFEQDQRMRRYETWDQVVDYCVRSANPVGRIVLNLAGFRGCTSGGADDRERELVRMSDATCTALQLINHWQDVRRDLLERDRVYLPSADTGITADMLMDWVNKPEDSTARVAYIRALRPLVDRTHEMFGVGRPLPNAMGGELAPVVWLFGAGGEAVLHAVRRMGCATLWNRPKLGKLTKMMLVAQAGWKFMGASRRAGMGSGA